MQNMACFYINQILLQIINVSLWSFIVLICNKSKIEKRKRKALFKYGGHR